MPSQLIAADDCRSWRALLAHMGEVDCTYLPEYHLAYSLRIKDSAAWLWHYAEGDAHFLYPFLLTPVAIGDKATGWYDISSIYGYTGPLATTTDATFLSNAWRSFDEFAGKQKIIAEFIRFSPFNHTERFAHPEAMVEANRSLAASELPSSEEALLEKLGSKTRNMLRKAQRAGLVARELAVPEHLPEFRRLYEETMGRNKAPAFFWYDDAYWKKLLLLESGLRLFGTFAGNRTVAAAMSLNHGKSGLYHLGASLPDYARQGAGNVSLFEMSRHLLASGVTFINMTGGRTTKADDPLLLFKKSNATGLTTFYIGKRIIDKAAYQRVRELWQNFAHREPDAEKIIFWRM